MDMSRKYAIFPTVMRIWHRRGCRQDTNSCWSGAAAASHANLNFPSPYGTLTARILYSVDTAYRHGQLPSIACSMTLRQPLEETGDTGG